MTATLNAETVNKNITYEDQSSNRSQVCEEILVGLTSSFKYIEPKYFYDEYGSGLFEKITKTDEYYPTRTEKSILKKYASEIASACGENAIVVEPGCGSCEKIRLLLDAIRPSLYVPMDISADYLQASAATLSAEYPWLTVRAVAADFSGERIIPHDLHVDDVSSLKNSSKPQTMVFYPGSTIGNMTPYQASDFLTSIRTSLSSGDGIILGVDLIKPDGILNAAYNDREGITAQFNLNILSHINRVASADFKHDTFLHHAFYNSMAERIEMYLVSKAEQWAEVAGELIYFEKGEMIHTEYSHKYSLEGIGELAQSAGFKLEQSWTDDQDYFSVNILRVV
ncbi:MAG: dimethylhistidine N-methyltransferase [Thalassolituus sp.]|jgi:dimethylhistidine N-methyltransferase